MVYRCLVPLLLVVAVDAQTTPPIHDVQTWILLRRGEASFAQGDFAGALKSYSLAAQQDPHSYQAAVNAGDAALKLHDLEGAASWYQRAITINPDDGLADRHWGEALLAESQVSAAREKLVSAVVAQPYVQVSWTALEKWAQRANVRLYSPRLGRPKFDNGTTQNLDPKLNMDDGSGRSAWGLYQTGRMAYQVSVYTKPGENQTYRHSLAEELNCLKRVAAAVRKKNIPPEKLDPGLKNLLMLEDDEMLEPWILLHGADAGISQDYAAYRTSHRDQLRAFIVKYDIQPITEPGR